jgi:hypothetical protein
MGQVSTQSSLFGSLPGTPPARKSRARAEPRSRTPEEQRAISTSKVQALLQEAKEYAEKNPADPDWAHRHTIGTERPYMYPGSQTHARVFVSMDPLYPYTNAVANYDAWARENGFAIEAVADTPFGKANAVSLRFRPLAMAKVATRVPPKKTGSGQKRGPINPPLPEAVVAPSPAVPRPVPTSNVVPMEKPMEPMVTVQDAPGTPAVRVDWRKPITTVMGEHDRELNMSIEAEVERVGGAVQFEENERRIDQALATAKNKLFQAGGNVRGTRADIGGKPSGRPLDHPQSPYHHIARRYFEWAADQGLILKTKTTETGYTVVFRVRGI